MITNKPNRQNVRKLKFGKGLYKPYGQQGGTGPAPGVGKITGSVDTDTVSDGTLYTLADSSAADPPAGTIKANAQATQAVSGVTTQNITINVTLPNGTYYLHYVQETAEGFSNVITSPPFSVPSAPSALIANITASRVSGVTPFTVVFSCDGTTAPGYDEHEIWRQFGYYFDFDDPTSGNFTTSQGGSRNVSIGGPMATHTFVVADGGGTVAFEVLVNIEGPLGEVGQASITVTVQAQDTAYDFVAGTDVIAVSKILNTGNPAEWESGFDRNVPPGATLLNIMPAWDAMSDSLVMIQRGAGGDFSSLTDIYNMKYGTKNTVISTFGNAADARPNIFQLHLGTQGDAAGGFDIKATDADYATYGGIWLQNITVETIKLGFLGMGMTYEDVGFHDVDMDHSAESPGLLGAGSQYGFHGCRGSDSCLVAADNLTPSNVPFAKGLYLSEMDMVGTADWQTFDAGSMSVFAPWAITWYGFVGGTIRRSTEHNHRLHAVYRGNIMNSDMLGDPVDAGKHNITFRGKGYLDIGDYSTQTWAAVTTGANYPNAPDDPPNNYDDFMRCRYGLVQNCGLSAGTEGAQMAVSLQYAPTSSSNDELLEDYIARDCVFTNTPNSPVDFDVLIAGRWMTSTEQTYQSLSGTDDDPTGESMNDIDLGSGTPSLTPMYKDQPSIPVPTAPR